MKNLAKCLAFTLVSIGAGATAKAAEKDAQVHFSCPPSAQGQRITAFEIQITAGRFTAVSALPQGWDLHIDNDPSLHSKIEGSTSIGAGALDCSLIRKLAISYVKMPIGDLSFDISGSMTTTTDFQSEKVLKLGKSNLQ